MSYYKPEVIEKALASGGWLPEEWPRGKEPATTVLGAVCCGIVGGTDIEFLHHYSSQAIGLVTHHRNQALLARVPDCADHMILAEQFLLWACLEYHGTNAATKFRGINIEYLYASERDAYNGARVTAYTHLIGHAKKNPVIASRLERRMQRNFPEYEARVSALSGRDQ